MNTSALAKDLAELRKTLYSTSEELKAVQKEHQEIVVKIENGRQELKNIQVLHDSLLQNYDVRAEQRKKELEVIEADIKAAALTREGIDEAAAERLSAGQQAILNCQKVEFSITKSIEGLRMKETSMVQNIANTKNLVEAETQELAQLRGSVEALRQEKSTLEAWVVSQADLVKRQEELELREQELTKGTDYLKDWEKEVIAYAHDVKVMEQRLKPAYMEAYKNIKSNYINGTYTERKGLQSQT